MGISSFPSIWSPTVSIAITTKSEERPLHKAPRDLGVVFSVISTQHRACCQELLISSPLKLTNRTRNGWIMVLKYGSSHATLNMVVC
ncbi:hypothetical protein V2G26_018013 [Clonostachys chloroleuca]